MKRLQFESKLVKLHVNDGFYHTECVPEAFQEVHVPHRSPRNEYSVVYHERIFIQFTVENRSVVHILLHVYRNLTHVERAVHENTRFLTLVHEGDHHVTFTVRLFANRIIPGSQDRKVTTLDRYRLWSRKVILTPPRAVNILHDIFVKRGVRLYRHVLE